MEDALLAFLHDRPRQLVATVALEASAQAFLVLELFAFLRNRSSCSHSAD